MLKDVSQTNETWQNKFYGAWLGRCIGCALGKPLESWDFMNGKDGNPGWKNVQLWFEGRDAWPIDDYVPEYSKASFLTLSHISMQSTKVHIQYMQSDDDIRYTVLGLKLLENKGFDFDSWHVGNLWHTHLPYQFVCTAETQAYLNFAQVTSHMAPEKPLDWENKIRFVRTYLNPYREWIGAQIRIDAYGYAAAGNPQLAAKLAWKDASFSHVKNGIYGAMFFAAVISASFVETDINQLIEIGLSVIPKNSRLAFDIKKAVDIASHASNQIALVEEIEKTFRHYHCLHTNNNAALCVAALLFGQGDFEKTITTAVQGGWDTDCNGATVGSIVGAMIGENNIPMKWKAPLHDTLYTEIIGFNPIKISECAKRSYEVFLKH